MRKSSHEAKRRKHARPQDYFAVYLAGNTGDDLKVVYNVVHDSELIVKLWHVEVVVSNRERPQFRTDAGKLFHKE